MDEAWKNHIHALNSVRESIHNRAYAQQDPLHDYKKEAFEYLSTCYKDSTNVSRKILNISKRTKKITALLIMKHHRIKGSYILTLLEIILVIVNREKRISIVTVKLRDSNLY